MAYATTEITWLMFLLRDISTTLSHLPQLFCDNMSSLHMLINPMFHARSKHIELNYHFICEKVAIETLVTQYVSSSSQLADIFTKPLPKMEFSFFPDKLGVYFHSLSILWGHFKGDYPTNEINSSAIISRKVVQG